MTTPRTDATGQGRLVVLMVTAFMDMVGILMVVPLMPFYAKDMHETGVMSRVLSAIGMGGEGAVVSVLVATFAIVQLVSAPYWGRVSDRFGRRPAMMIGLGGSALAYLVFAYAPTLDWLFISRIVQGAGGGTVGVIQAYVADSTKPEDRSKALGWLSAATNAGVSLGPVIGGGAMHFLGKSGPGLAAALMSCITMLFAFHYLTESHDAAAAKAAGKVVRTSSEAVRRVVSHSGEPASRLIWIYAITMGSFQAISATLALFLAWRFGGDRHDDWVLLHVHRGHFGGHARAGSWTDGRPVWRGAPVAYGDGAALVRPLWDDARDEHSDAGPCHGTRFRSARRSPFPA